MAKCRSCSFEEFFDNRSKLLSEEEVHEKVLSSRERLVAFLADLVRDYRRLNGELTDKEEEFIEDLVRSYDGLKPKIEMCPVCNAPSLLTIDGVAQCFECGWKEGGN